MIESYKEIFLAICLLILPLLYKTSDVSRYYLKYTIYIFVCTMVSFILMPYFCFRPRNVKNLETASRFCRYVSVLLSLEYELRNTQYIAEDKSFIVVSNHQSMLDILGMFHLWSIMKKCTAISKNEVFYVWPFGLGAWLAGVIFIPRTNVEKSKEIMTESCEKIKKDKTKLWIFPEGKRFSDGQIHPFKKGAFHLAISSELPILPVVFNQYAFLDHKKKTFDPGTVIVTILPPISTAGKTLNDLDDLLEETHKKMSTAFYEVNKEYRNSSH